MLSPYKLMGLLLQVAGMLVMMYAFLTLVSGIQSTISHVTDSFSSEAGLGAPAASNCDPKTDPMCGVDVTKEGAIESVFSGKVNAFIFWLGAGIILLFMGLMMRSAEELGGGFFSSLPEKSKLKQRMQVGRPGFGGAEPPPYS